MHLVSEFGTGHRGWVLDGFLLILIMAVPAVLLAVLGVLMNRWGKKHDPMGGSSKDILSTTGRPRRADTYHD